MKNADYVAARSVLDGVDLFDADFFGMLPRESELIDPQHRVFLEICWEALEDAGYVPQDYAGSIGVFAGCAPNRLPVDCGSLGFAPAAAGCFLVASFALSGLPTRKGR